MPCALLGLFTVTNLKNMQMMNRYSTIMSLCNYTTNLIFLKCDLYLALHILRYCMLTAYTHYDVNDKTTYCVNDKTTYCAVLNQSKTGNRLP